MTGLRRHAQSHPFAAAWLLAATLLMKLLIPVGFMPAVQHGSVGIELCRGFEAQAMPMSMPMTGHGSDHDHGKMPCDFSVLGGGTLAAGEPSTLAEPTVFAELPPTAAVAAFASFSPPHLRPPSRGPPTI